MPQSLPFFEQIVADYYDDIYRFALSLTGKESDAVDLTQNAFLKFAKKGTSIEESQKVKSWLFSVLRNEFIDIKRKNMRFPMQEIDAEFEACIPSPIELSDGQIAIKLLSNLPQSFREPLALYYLQGHTYSEIAELLNIPLGTVMSRLSRGKKQLRAQIHSCQPHG